MPEDDLGCWQEISWKENVGSTFQTGVCSSEAACTYVAVQARMLRCAQHPAGLCTGRQGCDTPMAGG